MRIRGERERIEESAVQCMMRKDGGSEPEEEKVRPALKASDAYIFKLTNRFHGLKEPRRSS